MEKINVAFVGLGRIADLHYPGYKGNKKARLYGVCDTDEGLAKKRKKEWKAVKYFTDFNEMMADPEIDAVEILTPQKLHEPMTIGAAEAGKHIALQKPMTIDLKSSSRILKAVDKSDKIFKITENYVFYPPIVLARKLIDDGAIGIPSRIRITFVSGGSGGWEVPAETWEWRIEERKEGRGMQTFDHGHHLYSTAWFLGGDIERIVSWVDSIDGVIDCPAVMMWKYTGQTSYGIIEYAHASEMGIPSKYYSNDEWIEITGSKGIIKINRCTGNIHSGPPLSLFNGKKWKHFADVKSDWVEGFKGATENFIQAIRGEAEPLLSGIQGQEILKFSLAIQRSSRERREVYMEEMDKRFPASFTRKKIRKDKKLGQEKKNIFTRIIGDRTAVYGGQAKDLTEDLLNRFDASAVAGWNCIMGLHILPQGDGGELKYTVIVKDGVITLEEGALPEKAVLTITVEAGVWAAILLGKKKIELAFIQGKIKLEGKAEEGLKIKSAFGL